MAKPELVYVNHIKSTPERVWQAITDPTFTQRYWYGTRVESDWKVGSPITFKKPEGMGAPDTGKVLVADKPRKLQFSWHIAWGEMSKEPDSRVTFTIDPDGDGVKLTLVHDEFTEGSQAYENLKNGWKGILAGLIKTAEE
ncbi:MAG TPA: SRPBCC family protein [Bauldia sp.]|nr:SRPBCC family protein [Bauldia sp.]